MSQINLKNQEREQSQRGAAVYSSSATNPFIDDNENQPTQPFSSVIPTGSSLPSNLNMMSSLPQVNVSGSQGQGKTIFAGNQPQTEG
jgi:hypothetical protein